MVLACGLPALADKPVITVSTNNTPLDRGAPLTPVLKHVDLFLYLSRKHEALVLRLAQALKGMKVDGTHNRLLSAISAD
jgi:hypothetical protein